MGEEGEGEGGLVMGRRSSRWKMMVFEDILPPSFFLRFFFSSCSSFLGEWEVPKLGK